MAYNSNIHLKISSKNILSIEDTDFTWKMTYSTCNEDLWYLQGVAIGPLLKSITSHFNTNSINNLYEVHDRSQTHSVVFYLYRGQCKSVRLFTATWRTSVYFRIFSTTSAGTEISDSPHKGALEGLDQMTLCLCIIWYKEIYLFQYFLFLCFCFVSHVFYFVQLEYKSQSCNLHLVDGTVYFS